MRDFIVESSLSRIHGKTIEHVCGGISGFRDDNPRKVNQRINREITAYLQHRGYSVTKVIGSYIENKGTDDETETNEESLFVCNDKIDGDDFGELEMDLRKLGELYDQDSILVVPVGGRKAYLVGTTHRDGVTPAYGEREIMGDGKYGNVTSPFRSKIRGREFAFESIQSPKTMNGKWGNYVVANEVAKNLGEDFPK